MVTEKPHRDKKVDLKYKRSQEVTNRFVFLQRRQKQAHLTADYSSVGAPMTPLTVVRSQGVKEPAFDFLNGAG